MEIYKIIVMSTVHITKESFDYLNGGTFPISFINDDGYGKVIRITDRDLEDADYPTDLLSCMEFAKKNGCNYVRFDSDATMYNELPKYEW